LSEQNLIDCVTNCYGCNGENVDLAYYDVILRQAGHFNSASLYPYRAINGNCKCASFDTQTIIVSYGTVSRTETALQNVIVTYGPVAITIDASRKSFQLYKNGVYNEKACSSTKLDHAVLAVGYDMTPSDYWLVKNSWGTSWGEAGYIRLTRNGDNQCGVAIDAVIPFDK
jgi:cathepsin L